MRRFFCPECRHPLEVEDGAVETVCPNCQVHFLIDGTNTGFYGTEVAANRSGESLGQYLLEHLLGEGGMGQVYRAIDTRNGIRVAVKVFHPRLVTFPELVERFRGEARTLRSVNHPGVVRLFEEGEERGLRYLAMELVPGVDLWTWRKENKPPLAQTLDLVLQLCEVLAFVHPLGIVHRDLKPQNLMITPEGTLKVLDFGLARMVFADRTLTRTGTVLGTPQYMAPEQLDGREVDHRTDLYAVGILLHHLLTGRPPIAFSETASALNPSVPKSIDRVIAKAVNGDPALRFQSALEMGRALVAIRDRKPAWVNVVGASLLAVGLVIGSFLGFASQNANETGSAPVPAMDRAAETASGAAMSEDPLGQSLPDGVTAAADLLVAPVDGIPVFPAQNEGKTPLRTLGKGESVTRLSSSRDAKGDPWLEVRTADGKTGFVPGRYFEGNR